MKRVIKGTEPASLRQWKALENEEWSPSYSVLRNPQKLELHTSLLHEQGYACCYCGNKIALESSHIEHFRPQKHFGHLDLEYTNLHASCQGETDEPKPTHCGHSKGSKFSEHAHISPLEAGCEHRFRFTLIGEIERSHNDDEPAKAMISLLALDIEYLNRRRKEKLEGIFDDDFLADSSVGELEAIIQRCRQPNTGQHEAFDHVIARYAEQLITP